VSREFEAEAERIKLSRVLGVPVSELTALQTVPAAQLHELRQQTSALFYEDGRRLFENLAKASRLLPVSALASMATRVFGPMFAARITGFLPAERAAAVAERLDPPFMAELSAHLDPRRVDALLARLPAQTIVSVAGVLHRERQFITMAMFVDSIPLPVISQVVDAIDDAEALLRIAFFVEDAGQLEAVIAHLDDSHMAAVVQLSATGSEDLQHAGLSLFERLNDKALASLAPHLAELDNQSIERLILLASKLGVLHVLVRALPLLPKARLESLAAHFEAQGLDLQRLLLGSGDNR
jgi:hypothetical protein